MNKSIFILAIIIFLLASSCQAPEEKNVTISTDSNKKDATVFTINANKALLGYLPFSDRTDYESAEKGFIATFDEGVIKSAEGNIVYNMKEYNFIKGAAPGTVNPSLWRQSELNSINGLFKVVDGIYQVRGMDLSNATFIQGETGWIVVDVMLSAETAKAAKELLDRELGPQPITAVLFTHSHIDHFGGIRGLVDEADVKSGKIHIYAPENFFFYAVSENIMAGNCMGRRASYMYGNLLTKDEKGMVGTGLGQTTSTGLPGVMEATDIISDLDGETRIIDGVKVEFIYTPDSEAPAEMMFFFPEYKAFCQAENVNHTLHNLYTLRGAKVRDGQKWSSYIDKALAKWGNDMEVSFAPHHWPTWGNEKIVELLKRQRDMYRFIHDQTLRLANHGYTPKEISEMLDLPESLDKTFANRGYYGSVSHDVKAQYELYFGWFDGNPANLNPLPPSEAGEKYVEFMGGADALLSKAMESYNKGEYRWVTEVLNHLVFADPGNKSARYLLADAYEQLGYQAESGPWRNFYLTGAKELRDGVKAMPSPNTAGPDMVRGMDFGLFLNYIAMRFIGTDIDAQAMKYNFNINLTDTNEKGCFIVDNGAVNVRLEHADEDVTAVISLKRTDLDKTSLGQATFQELVDSGAIEIEGDGEAFSKFLTKLDKFDFWFNIVEP